MSHFESDILQSDPPASTCAMQLWDYGVEGDSFVLVLRRYECSLAAWRAAQPPDPAPRLPLYLAIFADVLRAVQVPCRTLRTKPSILPSIPFTHHVPANPYRYLTMRSQFRGGTALSDRITHRMYL